MTSKRKKEAPSTPSTEFLANNLPSEDAEGIVAPGVTQVRVLGHQEDVERIVTILERDGFLKTGMAKEKPPSQDPHLWRAYLVKKTAVEVDEDAELEAEILAAEKALPGVTARLETAQKELAKCQPEVARIEKDLLEGSAKRDYGTLVYERQHMKQLTESMNMDIKNLQVQLTGLQKTIARRAELDEKARKKSLVKKCLENPPLCDMCGKPMTVVKHRPQPAFVSCTWYTKATDWRGWHVEFWCEGPLLKCRKPVRVYPDEPASTTPKMRIVQTTDGPRLTEVKPQ